jgi:UDP-glucose 4-epimerase
MKIIITGGLGYIGSNIAVKLLKQNHNILLIDNLKNSKISVSKKIFKLTKKKFIFKKENCNNKRKIFSIFKKFKPDLVIHLAGLKSVSESIRLPRRYLNENLKNVYVVAQAMIAHNTKKLIFSSSATVYGKPKYLPVNEDHPTNPINPYGKSKLLIEEYLKSLCDKYSNLSIVSLRYFNPVGSDKSGLLTDNPKKPNNLFPKILQVINGKFKYLPVFGKNYKTSNGTTIRDYIHILDLSDAHISSIRYLKKQNGFHVFNVGTGKGLTALEVIKKFEEVNNLKININFKKRRPGDVPIIYAGVKKIKKLIGWSSKYGINQMCIVKK